MHLDHRGRTRAERELHHERLIEAALMSIEYDVSPSPRRPQHTPVHLHVVVLPSLTGNPRRDSARHGRALGVLLRGHLGDRVVQERLQSAHSDLYESTAEKARGGVIGPMTERGRAAVDRLKLTAGNSRLHTAKLRLGMLQRGPLADIRYLVLRLGAEFVEPLGPVPQPEPVVHAPEASASERIAARREEKRVRLMAQ